MIEDTDIYSSFMSHLSQHFPKQRWSCFVNSQILSSALHFNCDAVVCFLGFVLKVLRVIEAQYLFATSFFFSELFLAVPDLEVRFPLMTSFVNPHYFSVSVGAYVCFH